MTTFKYPLEVSEGKIVLSDGIKVIPEAIRHCVETYRSERVLRPTYGIPELVFTNIYDIPDVLADLETSVNLGMTEYSGVSIYTEGTMGDDGKLDVTIFWQYLDDTGEVLVTI